MSSLVIPSITADEEERWPSLGNQVANWMMDSLVFGPGDLRGQQYRLDAEKQALLVRMYQVYPYRHPLAGQRRWVRVAISLRKGVAKTEFAAAIAAGELHPDAPVRCAGFDKRGRLLQGRGVNDPRIFMVSYTQEQTEDLAYSALMVMLGEGPLAHDFDIGLERIMRVRGDGRADAVAGTPNPRDGSRVTFEHFDETHRFFLPRLREAHKTMLANLPKRPLAQPWALETTTAYAPGQRSVAESTHSYALAIKDGRIADPQLFYYHRQANPMYRWGADEEQYDLRLPEPRRRAVVEASGPAEAWSNIRGICTQFDEPDADLNYLTRVWLNIPNRGSERAFDIERWKLLKAADGKQEASPGAMITLGFDGARTRDSTAVVATEVITGFQWLVGLWERPPELADGDEWEVDVGEVEETIELAMNRWRVWRMYCDPPFWQTKVSEWAGHYGEKVVQEWWTTRPKQTAYAVRAFVVALNMGELSHSGDPRFERHLANAMKRYLLIRDEEDKPLWLLEKSRPDSLNKIDASMAAVLSNEARNDALASGAASQGDSEITGEALWL